MTLAPPRTCSSCSRIVRGRCPTCARKRDQRRPSATARGYDHAWAAFSRHWLQCFPWCGQRADGWLHADDSRCWQEGRMVRAQVTDHIVALREGGAHMDPTNAQSLCTSCNVAKGLRCAP